jgi:ribosomal protein S12 methylthiotransferase accessory factor
MAPPQLVLLAQRGAGIPSRLVLTSTHITRGSEAFAYRLDGRSHRSFEDLVSLYHPTAGPVRKVVTYFGSGGSFRINVGHSEYYDLDTLYQKLTGLPSLETGTNGTLFGGGKGFAINDMFASSLGEAIERVVGSLAIYLGKSDQILGTARDLQAQSMRTLTPEEMPLFSAEQYATPGFLYAPFTDDTRLSWVEGRRMRSGESIWVPAQLVEMLHVFHPDEAVIGYSVSGGLSCHISEDDALFHGLTEVIERDQVNLCWYCRIPPAELVVDSMPDDPRLRTLLEDVAALPGDVRFYSHSIDFPEVPVVTAVQMDDWLKRLAWNAGGGVGIDGEAALYGAISEFCQAERTMRMSVLAPERSVSQAVASMFDIAEDADASQMTLFFQAIGFYGHAVNRPKLDWYIHGNPTVSLSELPVCRPRSAAERLAMLDAALAAKGIDPIVFDFTPDAMGALRLIKVFIPELTYAFLQSKPMLGHPRFTEVPERLGLQVPDELNPDPLPYP